MSNRIWNLLFFQKHALFPLCWQAKKTFRPFQVYYEIGTLDEVGGGHFRHVQLMTIPGFVG